MKSYWQKLFQWISNTPYRSLGRAYRASKRIRHIRKDSLSHMDEVLSLKYFWQAMTFYVNTEFNHSIFVIYWSLLECKLSIFILNIWNRWKWVLLDKISFSIPISCNIPFFTSAKKTPSQRDYRDILPDLPRLSSSIPVFPRICSKKLGYIEELGQNKIVAIPKEGSINDSSVSPKKFGSQRLVGAEKINRKLAWIEATLNDLETWKQYSFFPLLTARGGYRPDGKFYFSKSKEISVPSVAYESISLVPRSITRTSSRFQTELTGRSGSLIFQESRLAKYQALASLQYIGCLLIFPLVISSISNKWILEPWIQYWWDASQPQIFLNSIREEEALEKLRELEELLWLDKLMADSDKISMQDLSMEIHRETVQLVAIYNEESIQIISHLLTDIISFVTLGFLLAIGHERFAVLNSWIQELFYSLSDTTKAFTILPLTDLCIGFHSPHGWEIVIGSSSEHLGFAHDKYVISCFVSTFPVILDTVFKYWIFRHLNRISPSIVATYHTMSE
uniref:CemA protein n=1 Tax=Mankyua chejuensis TaxID=996148 RepID=H8Y628_9MONI|nr:chloroplast envelope membrane protein [Mankyua chejuensis]ADZ47996.1 chloroplast envelope membrane protein [Mankyua chejuensis]AJJ48626.1 envelope membrane protein [Mankyua chejuensis]